MKFYESSFDDYVTSCEKYNLHPEIENIFNQLPKKIDALENLIIYGPPGVGKYTQVLHLLSKYSPSKLKYEKKMIS